MDVEQRSGQFYNSEIPGSYIGISLSNNRTMNPKLENQKAKVRNQMTRRMHSSNNIINKPQHLISTFDVLPKIEPTSKSFSPDDLLLNESLKFQSTNNSSVIINNQEPDVQVPEINFQNNVQQWLQIPSEIDKVSIDSDKTASVVSSGSDIFTKVEVGDITDRTSVTSSEWFDDVCEFEKNESDKVDKMFEEIDLMLFSDRSSPVRTGSKGTNISSSFSERNIIHAAPNNLKRECGEWKGQFPHFRLVGRQIILSQEQGYSLHECERPESVTPNNSPRVLISNSPISSSHNQSRLISDSPEYERLSVVGHKMQPNEFESNLSFNNPNPLTSTSQEEVFASDGEIVEIIAIDYKMDDDDHSVEHRRKQKRNNPLFRSHKVYPPITPNAVMKDGVLSAVFDNLWSQVVEWILPLLTKIYQSVSSRDIVVMESTETMPNNNSLTPDTYRIQKSFYTLPANNSLDSILKISSKTLQFREKSNLQSIPEQTQVFSNNFRGPLSIPLGGVKYPVNLISNTKKRGADRSQTPIPTQESSFILDKDFKRPYVISQNNYVSFNVSPLKCLRGKGLYSSHSPDLILRSGTLPPINTRYQVTAQVKPTGSRIGSARTQNNHNQNISNNSLTGNVIMNSDINTRPCTSQTARSDLITGNRSSTPNGSRGIINLNVHGSSITMNATGTKINDELTFEQPKLNIKPRAYWKSGTNNNNINMGNSSSNQNQTSLSMKRNKTVGNSVK